MQTEIGDLYHPSWKSPQTLSRGRTPMSWILTACTTVSNLLKLRLGLSKPMLCRCAPLPAAGILGAIKPGATYASQELGFAWCMAPGKQELAPRLRPVDYVTMYMRRSGVHISVDCTNQILAVILTRKLLAPSGSNRLQLCLLLPALVLLRRSCISGAGACSNSVLP